MERCALERKSHTRCRLHAGQESYEQFRTSINNYLHLVLRIMTILDKIIHILLLANPLAKSRFYKKSATSARLLPGVVHVLQNRKCEFDSCFPCQNEQTGFCLLNRSESGFCCKYKEFHKDKYCLREYRIYSFCIFSAFSLCFFYEENCLELDRSWIVKTLLYKAC